MKVNAICRNFGEIVALVGAGLSTVGFVFILATALIFKCWRRRPINKVWLYICATNMSFVSLISFYSLHRCEHIATPWLETAGGSKLFWLVADYFMLSTSTWLAAGAWTTYQKLTASLSDEKKKPVLMKTAITAWLTPLPVCIVRAIFWCPEPPVYFIDMIPLIYKVFLFTCLLLSLGLYAKVLYSVCRVKQQSGSQQELQQAILLGIMFILLSGLQYAVVIIVNSFYDKSPDIKIYLYSIVVLISYYSEFVYSVMFTFGVKRTRKLWIDFLNKKIREFKN